MGATAPDSVGRLVDLSACNAQADRLDHDRLSGYHKEQLSKTQMPPLSAKEGYT
nr:hypothetical protein [bacterium]